MKSTALLFLLALVAACASAPEKPAATSTTPAAPSGVAECDRFADDLCAAVGADTEPCSAMRSMRGWLPKQACAAASADMSGVQARIEELRESCVTLAERLCDELGKDTEECRSVQQDMPRVPAGHCKVLLSHYPELVQQLKDRVARSKPLDAAVWQELLAGNAPSFGPATAKVQIVAFSDFECPYCSQAAEVVEQIRQKYGGEVRLVFRQFPLSFHPHAKGAAKASLAAHAQGKFWPMHDRLFQHQAALGDAQLKEHATQVGLDVAAFDKSMTDAAIDAALTADLELGRKAGVDGTPAMFVDGKRIDNATDFDEVAPIIDAALGK
jgi:protein-disulfide isomerase